MRTLKIELRYHPSNDTNDNIVQKAAKMAAKHLWTQALLIGEKRKPTIALYGSDFFSREEEISLADDIPQDEQSPEEVTQGGNDAEV